MAWAGLVLGALGATGASAADLGPLYKAPPAVEHAYSWTGFFAGGHVGYISGETTNDTNGALPDGKGSSWFAGVQGGYRYQLPSNFVIGAQISAPLVSKNQVYNVFGNLNHVDVKYAVVGQLLLGYAVDRTLLFVSGGVGATQVEAWEVLASGTESLHVTNTHAVYTAGIGVRYAVTDHVVVGFGYNHTLTSRKTYNCGPAVCGVVGAFGMRGDSVAGVLEYKF